MIWLMMLWGCGGAAECGPAECADICARSEDPAPTEPAPDAAPDEAPDAAPAQKPGAGMSDFEHQLLDELLGDVRSGVRGYGQDGIGLCTGKDKKACPEFLGLEAGELPPGDYLVRAELAVPDIGDKGTWKVLFHTDCTYTTVGGNGETTTTTKDYDREYDVIYAGDDRGYRLQPLRQITSPTKSGAREECTWTLTAPHPDGDTEWTGSWTVPEKG